MSTPRGLIIVLANSLKACQDPLEFLNPEFLLKAIIPALLAGLVWLLPLCAIASPASLTSIAQMVNESTTCGGIPSLNFTREETLTLDSWEEAMCFWDVKDDGTEYYNSPSDRLTKIATVLNPLFILTPVIYKDFLPFVLFYLSYQPFYCHRKKKLSTHLRID